MLSTSQNNIKINISKNNSSGGKTATIYSKNGEYYVEGREGTEYSVILYNDSHKKRLFVLSVDGLSVIDGEPASSKSRGFVLKGYQSIDVTGWVKSNTNAAKFVFSNKQKSYAVNNESTGNSSQNCGVIGVRIFDEKEERCTYFYPNISYPSTPQTPVNPFSPSPYMPTIPIWASATLAATSDTTAQNTLLGGVDFTNSVNYFADVANTENELGTGFGEDTEFNTKTVEFKVGKWVKDIEIFYGDVKWLNANGIVADWQKISKSKPSAFKDQGFCKPPVMIA